MTVDLLCLSIREIQQRFLSEQEPVPALVLAEMRKDARAGVRHMYHLLRRRREAEKQERWRLAALLNFERILWQSGRRFIAGVDEVGVGPLAGPVVAAAVVFPPEVEILGIDDSKRLDPDTRGKLAQKIREKALAIGIGEAQVEEIDEMNVYQAGILAMKRAVETLPVLPEHVLVDARTIPGLGMPQNAFCKGDGINFSIASASIVAKTYRDHLMDGLDRQYPQYGFARHKGYSTPEHLEAIRAYGPSPAHRRSYQVIGELCGQSSPLFYSLKQSLSDCRSIRELCDFQAHLKAACSELKPGEQRKLKTLFSRRWNFFAC